MGHFLAGQAIGLAAGWVVGCFTPGVYRVIKGWLYKEEKVIGSAVGAIGKKL
jgi:hypothetical protein